MSQRETLILEEINAMFPLFRLLLDGHQGDE